MPRKEVTQKMFQKFKKISRTKDTLYGRGLLLKQFWKWDSLEKIQSVAGNVDVSSSEKFPIADTNLAKKYRVNEADFKSSYFSQLIFIRDISRSRVFCRLNKYAQPSF